MIVDKVSGGLAKVTMSLEEAQVLHDALTVAKLQIGEPLLLNGVTGINVEHLRGVLAGLGERSG